MSRRPPKKIFLQWHGDAHPIQRGEIYEDAVTWCREQIYPRDFEYVLVPSTKSRKGNRKASVAAAGERKRGE